MVIKNENQHASVSITKQLSSCTYYTNFHPDCKTIESQFFSQLVRLAGAAAAVVAWVCARGYSGLRRRRGCRGGR